MRVCLFHPYDYDGKVGGTDIYVKKLVDFLIGKGIEPFIVCASNRYLKNVIEGVTVYFINLYEDSSFFYLEGLLDVPGVKQFRRILEQNKTDIIHFQGTGKPYEKIIDVAEGMGLKMILTAHLSSMTCLRTSLLQNLQKPCDGNINVLKCSNCYLEDKIKNKLIRELYLRLDSNIDKLDYFNEFKILRRISVIKRLKRHIESLNVINQKFSRIIVLNNWYGDLLLNNGFDKKKIIVIQTNELIKPSPFVTGFLPIRLIFAGRQNYSKGLLLLLEAMSLIQLNFPVILEIFGPRKDSDSNLINDLISKIKHANPRLVVKIHRNIDNHRLIEEISKSHLVVIPSVDAEMCPLILVEAQAKGIPVLGSNHTGIKDMIIDGHNGFLFERNNSCSLSKKIEELIIDTRKLEAVHRHLTKQVTTNNEDYYLDRILKVYNEL